MAGKIVADTLEHSTAGSIATNYVVEGSAKAWANIDGTGTIALRDSLNISSLTDDGTGAYDTNFTNSFNDTNYCAIGNAKEDSVSLRTSDVDRIFHPARTPFTTSVCEWLAQNLSGSQQDLDELFPMVLGDLA
jgi:hypothetical protein